MKKIKISKTLIIGALAVSMILPFGMSALANDSGTTAVKDSLTNSASRKEMRKGRHHKGGKENFVQFESVLQSLVEDGTLTSSQVDNIKTFVQENKGRRKNLFSEMIAQEILTQSQVDAILEKFHEEKVAKKREKMQTKLDDLVNNGTITNDQANEILDFINEKMEERRADFEKVKDMTAEERKEYFKENRPKKGNLIEELVDEGIITEEQSTELKKLMPQRKKGFGKKKGFSSEKLNEILNAEVEKGTITKEKAANILEFMEKKKEESEAIREKVKDMTVEERKAYLEENKPERKNLIEELVEEGIITQEEADELSNALPKRDRNSKGRK